MKDLLENKHFLDLKNKIDKKYPKDSNYFNFALSGIYFNTNQRSPELKIDISHYSSEEKIILLFNQVEFYCVTEESYLPHFKNNFKGFSFLLISKENELMEIMLKNGYDLQFDLRNISIQDFFIIRILGQNYFVDILTNKFPKVL